MMTFIKKKKNTLYTLKSLGPVARWDKIDWYLNEIHVKHGRVCIWDINVCSEKEKYKYK